MQVVVISWGIALTLAACLMLAGTKLAPARRRGRKNSATDDTPRQLEFKRLRYLDLPSPAGGR